jgi:hypothetical protein
MLATLGLVSCASPKKPAIIYEVAEGLDMYGQPIASSNAAAAPAPAQRQTAAPGTAASNNANDGLRLPNMLTLPDENQLRSATPGSAPAGEATIIARPPRD